jgi:hypothetical protein
MQAITLRPLEGVTDFMASISGVEQRSDGSHSQRTHKKPIRVAVNGTFWHKIRPAVQLPEHFLHQPILAVGPTDVPV